MIVTIIQGFLMALADSVPGVSGSTIAFILGYYEKVLESIHALLHGNKEEKINSLKFLIVFAIGWGVGFVGSLAILSSLFEKYVYNLSSLFLGLTIAAIPFIYYQEIKTVKGNYQHLLFTIIGASLVIFLTWIRSSNLQFGTINFLSLSPVNMLYLVVVGFIAICAMLLPGMSGSSVLLIFGLYIPIINAVKGLLHFNFHYLLGIILVGVGVILGFALGSGTIKKALLNHRSQMIYLIIGLMIGSIFAIINGPLTLENPQPILSLDTFNILMFIIGVVILVAMELVKKKKEN